MNAALNWDNGIPVQPGYRPPPIIDPTIVNFQNVQYQGPTAGQPGRIYNWTFNVQHEIKNFLVEVGYQGNRGTRLNSTIDLNQLPTSALSRGTLLQQRIDSPAAQAAGIVAAVCRIPRQPERRPVASPVPAVSLGSEPVRRLGKELVRRIADQSGAPIRLLPVAGELYVVEEPRHGSLPAGV